MPKHTRSASNSHTRYANSSMPVSLALPTLYNTQPRITMPSAYYDVPASSGPSLTLQAPAAYESYIPAGSMAVQPAVPHRPSSGAWSQQDDHQLIQARMQGLNWGQIQSTHFPNKSANACRKRHERLMERRNVDDWDNQKMQRIAQEYMNMRKEIWTKLAQRTGEKWNVVEHKCMSLGIKNIQNASRAATRRDRQDPGPYSGYDDDSGISGMGLTPVDELDASYSSPETTSSNASYHHAANAHAHAQAHLQPHPAANMAAAVPYGLGAYTGHGYSSSVSSTASAGHGYMTHAGASQGNSPYMNARPQSSDMGIGAIINRPGGGRVA